jgi:hypothetical protein
MILVILVIDHMIWKKQPTQKKAAHVPLTEDVFIPTRKEPKCMSLRAVTSSAPDIILLFGGFTINWTPSFEYSTLLREVDLEYGMP